MYFSYLNILGYIEEAALYIRRSIQINPDYSAARQNLENVCSHLVERWHFRMLNDVRRNCAYKIAIRRAAQRGHRSMYFSYLNIPVPHPISIIDR
jgi:type II protein arginine methyltransferase